MEIISQQVGDAIAVFGSLAKCQTDKNKVVNIASVVLNFQLALYEVVDFI